MAYDSISSWTNWNPTNASKNLTTIASGEELEESEITLHQAGIQRFEVLRFTEDANEQHWIKCRFVAKDGFTISNPGINSNVFDIETAYDVEDPNNEEYPNYYYLFKINHQVSGYEFIFAISVKRGDGKRAKYKYSRAGK